MNNRYIFNYFGLALCRILTLGFLSPVVVKPTVFEALRLELVFFNEVLGFLIEGIFGFLRNPKDFLNMFFPEEVLWVLKNISWLLEHVHGVLEQLLGIKTFLRAH